jgi:FolB domain-containing protein
MAKITINNLKVKARIGIEPRELKAAQEVVLNISYEYDARQAARTDDIQVAVDYQAMAERITGHLKRSRFNLLETMASEVVKLVMTDKRVRAASVTVTKARAIRHASGVSLTVATA